MKGLIMRMQIVNKDEIFINIYDKIITLGNGKESSLGRGKEVNAEGGGILLAKHSLFFFPNTL